MEQHTSDEHFPLSLMEDELDKPNRVAMMTKEKDVGNVT